MRNEASSKPILHRRAFLKSGALGTGIAIAMAGCGSKEDKLIPLLVPEERIVPGVDQWTPSTCSLCCGGCSTLVRSMPGEIIVSRDGHQQGRQLVLESKKIEGNARSPINRGRLCARGQAELQVTYNPDRIRTPMILAGVRGSGKFRGISWEEAYVLLEEKLKSAGSRLALICGPMSQCRRELVRTFASAVGSEHCWIEEAATIPTLREANRRMFGRYELESHDLENTRYMISFGANLVETHTSPVRYSLGFAHMRQGRPGERGKFVQVESRYSLTAANSDEWIPAKPGTEATLALAMAHVILKEDLFDKKFVAAQTKGFDDFRSWILEKYDPEMVAKRIDIPPKQIGRVAREFARSRPSVALAGGTALAQREGLFTALAVFSLNALVGSIGAPGGVLWKGVPSTISSGYTGSNFFAALDSISALILLNSNPVYSTPMIAGLRQRLDKIPFIVSFSNVADDSAQYSDLLLPDQTSLERWDLTEPEVTAGSRVLSITQPVIRPLYESRDSADVLLALTKLRGKPSAEDFRQFIMDYAAKLEAQHAGSSEDGSLWDKLLQDGVWTDPARPSQSSLVTLSAVRQAESQDEPETDSTKYPFYLQPFIPVGLGMGSEANLPWMQELPDVMTSIVWGSWLEMNPDPAEKLGIREGDLVWLESASGKVKVPVLLQRAARPDTLSMPFGQGHGSYGRYASGRGVNPWHILSAAEVRETGEAAWGATRVRVIPTGEKSQIIKLGYDRERSPAEVHR